MTEEIKRHLETITSLLSHNTQKTEELKTQVAVLSSNVNRLAGDIKSLNDCIQGSGNEQGLKTQTQILSTRVKVLEEDKKKKVMFYTAGIGGLSGLIALAKVLLGL